MPYTHGVFLNRSLDALNVFALGLVERIHRTCRDTTSDGASPERLTTRVVAAGASVVGVNCGAGLTAMLETVQSIHGETAVPLAAQPNAEFPDR